MNDVTAKLAEALRRIADRCPTYSSDYKVASVGDIARQAIAAYEQAQAEPKQAAEPVAYVDRMSLLWLSAETRTPAASVATDLYKTAPGDGWVGIYTAPVAATPAPAPAAPLRDAQEQPFEDWWEREGQFCRAGGGAYEKTFAWNAWCAAQAATPAPAPQWQPIETAPKDKVILLAVDGAVYAGCWYETEFRELRDTDGFYVGQHDAQAFWCAYVMGECEPSHWMPLPVAPEGQGKEASNAE